MELILYYIKESGNILIYFLCLILTLGFFSYISIKSFKQENKIKIFLYGLFMGIKNIDILKLSIISIRIFLIIYATMITEKNRILLSITMISILTIIYLILWKGKKIIYEVVTNVVLIVMIYLNYVIIGYTLETEYSYLQLIIRIPLIVFVLMLSTYSFFKNIEVITENRVNKTFKKKKIEESITEGK